MMNILIIGGSGFVSGTLARRARDAGHSVTVVTRGEKPIPAGVRTITADRHDGRFAEVLRADGGSWDLAVDCIGYTPEDARQDLDVIAPLADHLVFVSTDFVYDPAGRMYPQEEDAAGYLPAGYGGKKREAELLFEGAEGYDRWTILRPCHIYGPGSRLGCLPLHGRDPDLIAELREGTPIRLAAGGVFLQQPIFAADLADIILSVAGKESARRKIMNTAGPELILSSRYYEIIAELLGVTARIEEVPVSQLLREKPDWASFFCHRIYNLSRLAESGAAVPATGMVEGLTAHVESLLE